MWTRREFLIGSGSLVWHLGHGSLPELDRTAPGLIGKGDLKFLEGLARETISAATKSESITKAGFAFVTPGGHYPALWVRDFSMAVDCGLIPAPTIHEHFKLIARVQNGPKERRLSSGGVIPPFAIPDHIDYDGKPVFFPGTYSSGEDQGGEPWGILPPVDDHFEFVHIAHSLWRKSGDPGFLLELVAGVRLFDRLANAVDTPEADPSTGLIVTDASSRAVGFGFCDGIYLTGSLLFASLLRYRALGEVVELAGACRVKDRIQGWSRQRRQIHGHLAKTFFKSGWLIAATGVGRQPDVWGTCFALCLGILEGRDQHRALLTLADAYERGTITFKGAVRHVPTDHDFSSTSAWEKTAGEQLNRYQNGAYWHVPTGWLVRALGHLDTGLAKRLVSEMIAHFREEDFRSKHGNGAPWECLHPQGDYRQNPIYMASVTLPLALLQSRTWT